MHCVEVVEQRRLCTYTIDCIVYGECGTEELARGDGVAGVGGAAGGETEELASEAVGGEIEPMCGN